jgi:hypothetical protein
MRISFETIYNACFSNSKTASASCLFIHIFRDRIQQKQMTNCIDHLKPRSIAMVIDFSENYGCLFQSEVQSGFLYRNQVTIHPMMEFFTIAPRLSQICLP